MAFRERGHRALAILTDLPFPPRSGNHLRYLQQLRLLAGLGYDVRVTSGITRSDDPPAVVGPVGTLDSTLLVPGLSSSPLARLRRMVWLAGATLGGNCADPSALAHRAAGFDEHVLRSMARVEPHLVLLPTIFTHLLPKIEAFDCTVIIDAHDAAVLTFEMLRRQETGLEGLALRLHTATARRAELQSVKADEVWVASRRELDYYRQRFPALPRVLVPNGVEVPPLAQASRVRPVLMLVANYEWPPNLQAAKVLVETILPRVREHVPDARATLIGRGISDGLRARWADMPVDCLGEVENVEPHVRSAAAVVFAPPRWAETALPLKLAEALAWGTPIAVTPWPVMASNLKPYTEAIISADLDVLATQLTELLSNRPRREELRANGYRWACENLATEAILGRLRAESLATQRA